MPRGGAFDLYRRAHARQVFDRYGWATTALPPGARPDLRVLPRHHKERSLDETSSWRPFLVSGGTKERVGPDAEPSDPSSQT
jgi:hypothetical protein